MRAIGANSTDFCSFLLSIGDGTRPYIPDAPALMVELPMEIVSGVPNLSAFLEEIYPEIEKHFGDNDFFEGKAILSPR